MTAVVIKIWTIEADRLPVHHPTSTGKYKDSAYFVAFFTSAEEGGYVFSSVCFSVCLSGGLFVCLSVGLLANL